MFVVGTLVAFWKANLKLHATNKERFAIMV